VQKLGCSIGTKLATFKLGTVNDCLSFEVTKNILVLLRMAHWCQYNKTIA